jgi:ribonuclease BN (tRNA processing enzyme)
MKLTVVGCSPAWPNPGGAHSGYLVEDGGGLLLDCGPGVLARLRELDGPWPQLQAIAISHWHLDHWGDLVPWVWGNLFGLGQTIDQPELWIPPGGISVLARFGAQLGTETMFEDAFRVSEYAEGQPFTTAAGLEVTTARVPHYRIDTYAMRVTNNDRTLAYSGDSAPTERLTEVARNADLFVCEATLASGELDDEPRGHLSADEALAVFEASGARRLLLTHRPGELQAPAGAELAHDGQTVDV